MARELVGIGYCYMLATSCCAWACGDQQADLRVQAGHIVTSFNQSESITYTAEEGRTVIGSENLCGQNSLLLAGLYLGHPVDPEFIDATVGVRGRPVSMLELNDAAEQLGFACLALDWDAGLELRPSTVAIVPLQRGEDGPSHYVVVTARMTGTYQVLDFGRPPMYWSLATLRTNWDGYALHLARGREELEPLLHSGQSDSRLYFLWIAVLAGLGLAALIWRLRRAIVKVRVES